MKAILRFMDKEYDSIDIKDVKPTLHYSHWRYNEKHLEVIFRFKEMLNPGLALYVLDSTRNEDYLQPTKDKRE